MKEMYRYTMRDVSGFFFPFLSTVTAIIIEKLYRLIRIMTKRLIMMVNGGIAIQVLDRETLGRATLCNVNSDNRQS